MEALEAEVNVLKSEIQTYSGDPEQILQHYYPALRVGGEDSEPSETVLRAVSAIREKRSSVPTKDENPDGERGSGPAPAPVGLRREQPVLRGKTPILDAGAFDPFERRATRCPFLWAAKGSRPGGAA